MGVSDKGVPRFDKKRFNEAVSFSFDIRDACLPEPTEHSNSYTTYNGHELDVYEVFSADGTHLFHAKVNSHNNGNIRILANEPYVLFVFAIHRARHFQLHGRPEPAVVVNELKHHAFYMQAGHSLHVQWASATGIEYMEISIAVDQLLGILPERHFLHATLAVAKQGSTSCSLYPRSLPIWPQLKTVLYEMTYNRFRGLTKTMYIKAKVMEMLAIQQAKVERLGDASGDHATLSPQEREKVLHARAIILEHIQAPLSLNELAHRVGTNECYLKAHFKQVFGTTIYGYINQTKMERARKLLKSKDKKVSEIAHMVGYKHAAHFTAAFKKHFGYTPNKISVLFASVGESVDWGLIVCLMP